MLIQTRGPAQLLESAAWAGSHHQTRGFRTLTLNKTHRTGLGAQSHQLPHLECLSHPPTTVNIARVQAAPPCQGKAAVELLRSDCYQMKSEHCSLRNETCVGLRSPTAMADPPGVGAGLVKSSSGKRELSLLAGGGSCSDEFSLRSSTSCPWQRGGSQRGRAGAGTCWAGSTHGSRGQPCRAPPALAAERLVRMALPLPGTRPAPRGRMAQARRQHTRGRTRGRSYQCKGCGLLLVCEYQKLVRYHTRDGGKS